jgi:hypothetical protein
MHHTYPQAYAPILWVTSALFFSKALFSRGAERIELDEIDIRSAKVRQWQELRLAANFQYAEWLPLFVGVVPLTVLLDVKPWGHTNLLEVVD